MGTNYFDTYCIKFRIQEWGEGYKYSLYTWYQIFGKFWHYWYTYHNIVKHDSVTMTTIYLSLMG